MTRAASHALACLLISASTLAATPPGKPLATSVSNINDGRIRVQLIARNAVTLSGEIAAKIAADRKSVV